MGVPAFFRWLSSRNPQIILNAQENDEDWEDPENDPTQSVNPEVDNLYLDMNGIIHPCCHPENKSVPQPVTLEDMFNNVFMYVDKIMNIIRPQKILYMAIDGVAPRAKMNQQRCRRFRSVQEGEEMKLKKQKLRDYWKEQGIIDPEIEEYLEKEGFDSNVITPGTEFMQKLAVALNAYIYERMNSHPLWKNLKVILSDSNIPGEGEHKILEFIRLQRSQPDYNPNTKHVLYGADADLIMLGLSTHEPYFYIFREQIISDDQKSCTLCGKQGHFFTECKVTTKQLSENDQAQPGQQETLAADPRELCITFQFAKLSVMREYLDLEFKDLPLDFEYNLEKIIDDFNFMCFFVGNDFLPHIPTLSIREGGIDALFFLYKRCLNSFGGYLTDEYKVNLKRVSIFMQEIGKIEELLFKDKEQKDEYNRKRNEMQNLDKQHSKDDKDEKDEGEEVETQLQKFKKQIKEQARADGIVPPEVSQCDPKLKDLSYKERWYKEKFNINSEDYLEFVQKIRKSYAEGLCWNYAYYYRGCISWNWYYPFHYAPFASDLTNLQKLKIEFEYGQPFKPFYQLLSVFPSGSRKAVPKCYHDLMTNPESPIIDFYPTDFFVDLKGKRYAWLGEVILPFIDEERLVSSAQQYDHLLTPEEQFRNRLGACQVFVQPHDNLMQKYNSQQETNVRFSETGLAGMVKYNKRKFHVNGKIPLPFSGLKLEIVESNKIEQVIFENPPFTLHICELKQGLTPPAPEIDEQYLGKTDKRMYGGQKTVRLIARFLGVTSNTYDGKGRKFQQENNFEKHNNQFVLRQQQTGNVNFRSGAMQSEYEKKRYQRIQEFNQQGSQNNNQQQQQQQQQQYNQGYQHQNQHLNQHQHQQNYNQQGSYHNNYNNYNNNRNNSQGRYNNNQNNRGNYNSNNYNNNRNNNQGGHQKIVNYSNYNNNNNNNNNRGLHYKMNNLNQYNDQRGQQQQQFNFNKQSQSSYSNNQPYFIQNRQNQGQQNNTYYNQQNQGYYGQNNQRN